MTHGKLSHLLAEILFITKKKIGGTRETVRAEKHSAGHHNGGHISLNIGLNHRMSNSKTEN